MGARQAASRVALMLALVRGVLLDGLSSEEARGRREAHTARIRRDAKSLDAVKAAEARLLPVPWTDRPRIHLMEFVQGAGPEAFLNWDAVFQELCPS